MIPFDLETFSTLIANIKYKYLVYPVDSGTTIRGQIWQELQCFQARASRRPVFPLRLHRVSEKKFERR